ncbi:ABC transporter substrate-binding protein [Christensenellaceae bacterium OttesenSCG-928-K19]|nr:ABC transporter substrate-binding protein [Christensenellaceae bacterium OttesenSCG-928-K19]
MSGKSLKRISLVIMLIMMVCALVFVSACSNNGGTANEGAAGDSGAAADDAGAADDTGGEDDADAADAGAASDGESIKIGWVLPLTGPVAEHTVTIDFVMEKALDIINNEKGGIYIEEYGKKVPIEIIKVDSESDATVASEAAEKLVLSNKVDLLCSSWTPMDTVPVSAVAERNNIPALMENSPSGPWLESGPYTWSFGNLFEIEYLVDDIISGWETIETNKIVGFVYDNSVDGVSFSALMQEKAEAAGYTVIDPGRFPVGTNDYTSMISEFKSKDCDIITGDMAAPDFAVMWRQFHQQGLVPKVMSLTKAGTMKAGMEAVGDNLAAGVNSAGFYHREFPYTNSLTGQTSTEMVDEWQSVEPNGDPTTLGYDWQMFEVIYDVFTRAGSIDRETVRDAIAATNLETSFGTVEYADDHVYRAPVFLNQWFVDDAGNLDYTIIAAVGYPEIPILSPLQPVPGSDGAE